MKHKVYIEDTAGTFIHHVARHQRQVPAQTIAHNLNVFFASMSLYFVAKVTVEEE